jgi:hypothetical protein
MINISDDIKRGWFIDTLQHIAKKSSSEWGFDRCFIIFGEDQSSPFASRKGYLWFLNLQPWFTIIMIAPFLNISAGLGSVTNLHAAVD